MSRSRFFIASAMLALCLGASALPQVRAETFVLVSGGRIEGELVNTTESPRKTYVVALPSGGKVTLPKSSVTHVLAANPAEESYAKYLQKMPDTVDGHWKMADWCVRNGLTAYREFHLREIVRREPGHEKARLALGYTNIDGQWVQPDEHNQRLGYVKFEGAWRTPQDVVLATSRRNLDSARRKWKADIKTWRNWLERPSKHEEAVARFRAVRDPLASSAIAELLEDKKEPPQFRRLYLDILGQMVNDSPLARGTLVNHVLYDQDPQIREKSLDYLENCNRMTIGAMFAKALGDKKNEVVNRAAVGIARMKYTEAIPQLIEALTTRHKYMVTKGGGNGSIGATFGAGGGGLSAGGGGPKMVEQDHNNDSVLQALLSMTGGTTFGFNKERWRTWYAESKVPQEFDLRRRP